VATAERNLGRDGGNALRGLYELGHANVALGVGSTRVRRERLRGLACHLFGVADKRQWGAMSGVELCARAAACGSTRNSLEASVVFAALVKEGAPIGMLWPGVRVAGHCVAHAENVVKVRHVRNVVFLESHEEDAEVVEEVEEDVDGEGGGGGTKLNHRLPGEEEHACPHVPTKRDASKENEALARVPTTPPLCCAVLAVVRIRRLAAAVCW
jgi:hypothetical protein